MVDELDVNGRCITDEIRVCAPLLHNLHFSRVGVHRAVGILALKLQREGKYEGVFTAVHRRLRTDAENAEERQIQTYHSPQEALHSRQGRQEKTEGNGVRDCAWQLQRVVR